jgi:hypothetical protein
LVFEILDLNYIINQNYIKPIIQDYMKDKESMKLSKEEIRSKIIEALNSHFLTPKLIDVFSDSITYSLESVKNKKSFHKVTYTVIKDEVVINWKESKWIKPEK